MYRTVSFLKLVTLAFLFTFLTAVGAQTKLFAAQLTLNWTDNSTNESGFKIERRTGTSGTFAQVAMVGASTTSYVDNSLANATTYCYRVKAYNSAGDSAYTNVPCATTATTPPPSYLLSITKGGTGSGTVTGTGISCGSDCSESYTSGTKVTLTATAASGSTFAGWTGTGCASTVTMNGNMTCKAMFNASSSTSYLLTVTKAGTGTGHVNATGINCGSDCSESYTSGTKVTLTATAASGSSFYHWEGTGCTTGTVTVNGNMTCTAIFNSAPVSVIGRIGIYRPSSGEWFLGWRANGNREGGVDMYIQTFSGDGAIPIVGDWSGAGSEQLGLFQPNSLHWYLDLNNNRAADGCEIDGCEGPFGWPNDMAVVGKWDSNGNDRIGTFRPSSGYWYLDKNGDGHFDGCKIDGCGHLAIYLSGDLPVVGDWSGMGITQLGLYRPSTGEWFLDSNGNGLWNGCKKDRCVSFFGTKGDLPISGDWDGAGKSKIGVFRPSTGEWFLDYNGDGQWNGCDVDVCLTGFGLPGDFPVVGKW